MSIVSDSIRRIQSDYVNQLAKNALSYLKVGLSVFQVYQRLGQYGDPQVAVGNLSISVELMLKCFIAKKNLSLLFKGLPLEAKVMLTCLSDLPSNFNTKNIVIDFKAGAYPTIELDECIATLYIFSPELRQSLQSHLKYIARTRNASVHSIIPAIHSYETERVAYTALKLYEAFSAAETFGYKTYSLSKTDTEFLARFDSERIERVQKSIEQAKERSKKIAQSSSITLSDDDWYFCVMTCPVCGSDGIAEGQTEISQGEPDQNGELPEPMLWFFPDSFQCDDCGLRLNDYTELTLAGAQLHDQSRFDRTNMMSEFLKWQKQ